MPALDAVEWADIGRENLRVAELLLRNGSWRSCVSRGYYSAMATAHALLIRLGMTPPERGNWPNPGLDAMLFAVLKSRSPSDGAWIAAAKVHRIELANCWAFRLQADYAPRAVLSERVARESIKGARRLRFRWESIQ